MERYLGPTQQINLVILKLQDRALPLPLHRAGEEAFAMLRIKTYCPATSGICVILCIHLLYGKLACGSGVSYHHL